MSFVPFSIHSRQVSHDYEDEEEEEEEMEGQSSYSKFVEVCKLVAGENSRLFCAGSGQCSTSQVVKRERTI